VVEGSQRRGSVTALSPQAKNGFVSHRRPSIMSDETTTTAGDEIGPHYYMHEFGDNASVMTGWTEAACAGDVEQAEEWEGFYDDEGGEVLTKMTTSVQVYKDDENRKFVNQYQVLKKIGSGSYGKVKLCHNTHDNRDYALKIINKEILRRKRTERGCALDDVMREISIMSRLQHPNIVRLYEVIDNPNDDKMYLVLEHLPGGVSMAGSVYNTPLSEETSRKYMRDILNGLEYLHFKHVIHRDLKPENLLLDAENGSMKIVDFGVSYVFHGDDDTMHKTAGSPAFMAPEVCAALPGVSGRAVDIWALGVTLYVFIFGMMPFLSDRIFKIYQRIIKEEPVLPRQVSVELEDLLHRMLTKDPDQRITLPEIKMHPWISENGANPMEPTEFDNGAHRMLQFLSISGSGRTTSGAGVAGGGGTPHASSHSTAAASRRRRGSIASSIILPSSLAKSHSIAAARKSVDSPKHSSGSTSVRVDDDMRHAKPLLRRSVSSSTGAMRALLEHSARRRPSADDIWQTSVSSRVCPAPILFRTPTLVPSPVSKEATPATDKPPPTPATDKPPPSPSTSSLVSSSTSNSNSPRPNQLKGSSPVLTPPPSFNLRSSMRNKQPKSDQSMISIEGATDAPSSKKSLDKAPASAHFDGPHPHHPHPQPQPLNSRPTPSSGSVHRVMFGLTVP